jgi:hypothetical protein
MNTKIIIRDEVPDDADAITDVTISAFKTLGVSQHTEQFIVSGLRIMLRDFDRAGSALAACAGQGRIKQG